MKTYVVEGFVNGYKQILIVTTNLEKAKSLIISDGWGIEVWENEVHLYDINYFEDDGFYCTEVNNAIT